MMDKVNAKAEAIIQIANLFGAEYVKQHIIGACEAYPAGDDVLYDYFLGFEGDRKTDKWTVFADVRVNRETEEVTFLDYKLPDGTRMKNPPRPIWRA